MWFVLEQLWRLIYLVQNSVYDCFVHFHPVQVELNRGNNVLYWRSTAYTLQGSDVKPVLLRNIAISGRLSSGISLRF